MTSDPSEHSSRAAGCRGDGTVEHDDGQAVEQDGGDVEGVVTGVGDVGQAGKISAHFRDREQSEPWGSEDGGPFSGGGGRGEQPE
ncbi:MULTISPECIES: hypothetical protein [Nocardia]|uniref:Uncharacterized protein n=1 Tax=Nocardia sputorum TaxID=2984338 RepID=A0ABM8CYL2_9NOCA|nr:hypothetical protein [Nocardia sputorum]BDT91471.1 hypothetical protein IFM12275_14470 [Nocardia sputorum]BDU00108.1 hypothetical protein IFM12276_31360 [Nocardia sputorum]